jgi:TPR repeat protein
VLCFRLSSSSDHLRYKQALGYEYDKTLRPLGDMYFEGRGTIRDLEMAKWLYKKAAKNGDELAQKKYVFPSSLLCHLWLASCVCACCNGCM